MKPVLPVDIFEMMTGLKWFFAFISTRFTIEYAEPI
jgi:hypothetical protein